MSAEITHYLNGRGVKFVTEHKFLKNRRFRFDYAILDKMIAVEFEGAVWTGGRHVRGTGYRNDCEKYSLAAIDGWCVVRVTADMVKTGLAFELIDAAIERRWRDEML